MFDRKHYVPVLRWKQAEREALQYLESNIQDRITPLIELIPSNFKEKKTTPTFDLMLSQTIDGIFDSWGKKRFFIDLQHLDPNFRPPTGGHLLRRFGEEADKRGLSYVPTTGLSRVRAYQEAVKVLSKKSKSGVCIRLCLSDLRRNKISSELYDLLGLVGASPKNSDLIIDCQYITDNNLNFKNIYNEIPDLQDWRTFTVIGGAFSKNLSGFSVGQHELARLDWMFWKKILKSRPSFIRLPSYGDYTIQHPIYSEPPVRSNFSASIRYTSDDCWVIMRGEGVFNQDGPGYAQWPANAELLCDRSEFCGEDFCFGDQYIKDMSMQVMRPGNPTTWLRAGINHHLSFVVNQISNFL